MLCNMTANRLMKYPAGTRKRASAGIYVYRA